MVSFTSDWLFPTPESRAIVHALNASGARVSFAEIVTDKGHDAFLLDEPELFAIVRGFLDGAAKARGLQGRQVNMLSRLKRDLTMADAARAPGGARVDLLLVADMVAPGAKVLDIGAGDGELLRILGEQRGVDGRGIEIVARGRQRMRRQGPRGDPGRRRHRPRRLSERRLRLRHPVADLAGDAPAARGAGAHAADRPARASCRSRISATGRSGCSFCFGGHMPSTDNLPYAWWESPNIHFCTIKDFVALCDVAGAKMDRAVAFNAWGTPLRFNAPWWFWNLFGEQAVFLLSRRG